MLTKKLLAISFVLLLSLYAAADSIQLDGTLYEGVYITESDSVYYVRFPDTGKSMVALKENVDASDVVISPDEAAREAMKNQWSANSNVTTPRRSYSTSAPGPRSSSPIYSSPPSIVASGSTTQSTPTNSAADAARRQRNEDKAAQGVPDGMVPYIDMKNVPLGDALRAILRTQGLDYVVQGNHIWISDPWTLVHEPLEPVVTRNYELRNIGSETMYKLVLRNPVSVVGGNGFEQISNISQMFSTIDDRMVGETPAVTNIGGVSNLQNNTQNGNARNNNGNPEPRVFTNIGNRPSR